MRSAPTDTAVFRKQFSISQQDLAAYLGISYSSLAMYERGDRPLATKAHVRFSELLIAYETAKRSAKAGKPLPALQAELGKQHDEAVTKMEYSIIDHRRRVQMLQHKLKAITAKQDGAATWLQIIDTRLATLPKTAATKADRQGLEEMKARACAGMVKNNEQKLKLPLTIALLEAEVVVYEDYLLTLKKGCKG